jgi:hypothetical protein
LGDSGWIDFGSKHSLKLPVVSIVLRCIDCKKNPAIIHIPRLVLYFSCLSTPQPNAEPIQGAAKNLSRKDFACMDTINFTKAYYIKLGKGGIWEESSINEDKARIGWKTWQLSDINEGDWEALKKKYRKESKTKGAATADLNALKNFAKSTSDDIWITFHSSRLWWCHLGETDIQEDDISKYRQLSGKWQFKDTSGNSLLANQIPGTIGKVQGFRGTICTLSKDEVEALKRLLNDVPSEAHKTISQIKANLVTEVAKGMEPLHWKDFETLVDLVFRNAGWRRVSLLGEEMKYVDMELQAPITGDMYQVQVKSTATLIEYEEYAQQFLHGSFKKLYFVVHSPEKNLAAYVNDKYKDVELILPNRLAEMVVDLGLTDWLLKKIK